MAELDPLSQLIGGLSAQITSISTQIVELRSDVVTNRNAAQTRSEQLASKLDLVQAEYRNVKHLERNIETEKIALGSRIGKIDNRLDAIETRIGAIDDLLLVWQTRVVTLMSIGAGLGVIVGFLINAGVAAAIKLLFG